MGIAALPQGDELWLNWVVRRRGDHRAVGHVAATVSKAETAIAWIVGTLCARPIGATTAKLSGSLTLERMFDSIPRLSPPP